MLFDYSMTIISKLTLTVHDLQKVSDFYQQSVGLRLFSTDSTSLLWLPNNPLIYP